MNASAKMFTLAVLASTVGCANVTGTPDTSKTSSTSAPTSDESARPMQPNALGYVHIPGGIMTHASCVHHLPNGARIGEQGVITLNGEIIGETETCPYKPCLRGEDRTRCGEEKSADTPMPNGGGWVAWSAMTAPSPNTSFDGLTSSKFTVPPDPSPRYDGQVLYYFPSLETPGGWIVQPVLQWGQTCLGSFNTDCIGSWLGWTYAPWAVQYEGSAYFGDGLSVNAGDQLEGSMTLEPLSITFGIYDWWIQANDVTQGTMALMFEAYSQTGPLTTANSGVLETYNESGGNICSDFPNDSSGSTIFSPPTLYGSATGTVTPSWTYCWAGMSNPPGICVGSNDYTGKMCSFGAMAGPDGSGTSITY